jgi:hypothetical protein
MIVEGARPQPMGAQVALDWAAALNAKLDTLPREDLEWLWTDDLGYGPRMRALLKTFAPDLLTQLAIAVRDRAMILKASEPA